MFTKEDIFNQLRQMNAPRDSVVHVHTSLRLIGNVEGGGEGLLDILIEYFTADGGLLVIPTHTWGNLRKDKITLDLTEPWSNLGAFSLIAANDKRAVRSENPTHSVAVFGDREKAIKYVENDASVKTPTSPDSVYGKLFYEKGYVLLAGVNQSKNTYLHAVAEILGLPDRMDVSPVPVTVKKLDGEVIKRDIVLYDCSYTDDISWHFPKYETAFRYKGAITDGFIGNAPTQLCNAVKMKETVELIWKNSEGKDPLSAAAPIKPQIYC